ncbi:MAG: trimethylamine methyltransferase family protein [Promethearchaeota archaeon]
MVQSRLSVRALSIEDMERIYEASLKILSTTGIIFQSKRAIKILAQAGAKVDNRSGVVKFPEDLVSKSLKSCPTSFALYSRDGRGRLDIGNNNVYFNPGSAALNFLDSKSGTTRKPVTGDFIKFIKVAENLSNIHAQSTSLVCSDIPSDIADRYRLYLVLKHSIKPIITGTFTVDGTLVMKNMLSTALGGGEDLSRHPTAIFDCCPSPPLMFSEITAESLIDCAHHQIPVELISMPLMGANAPVTIAGALVQHTSETLSGIVLAQAIQPGTPVVYGGSPSAFDMRYGTTPMGAAETVLIDIGYSQIGKWLGLPTHSYLGMSDSKVVDAQAGFESGIGAVMGAMAGINVISGAGMLEFENTQSIEKLVIDNEICGMALRIAKGFEVSSETMAVEELNVRGKNGSFMGLKHTLNWFEKEHYVPSKVVDRTGRKLWEKEGRKDILKRVKEEVESIIEESESKKMLSEDTEKELDRIMLKELEKFGIRRIPK